MQPQFVGCMDVSDTGGCLHTDITTSAIRRSAVRAVHAVPCGAMRSTATRSRRGLILVGVSEQGKTHIQSGVRQHHCTDCVHFYTLQQHRIYLIHSRPQQCQVRLGVRVRAQPPESEACWFAHGCADAGRLAGWQAGRAHQVRGVGEPDATIPTYPKAGPDRGSRGRQPGVASAVHDATKTCLSVTG